MNEWSKKLDSYVASRWPRFFKVCDWMEQSGAIGIPRGVWAIAILVALAIAVEVVL